MDTTVSGTIRFLRSSASWPGKSQPCPIVWLGDPGRGTRRGREIDERQCVALDRRRTGFLQHIERVHRRGSIANPHAYLRVSRMHARDVRRTPRIVRDAVDDEADLRPGDSGLLAYRECELALRLHRRDVSTSDENERRNPYQTHVHPIDIKENARSCERASLEARIAISRRRNST